MNIAEKISKLQEQGKSAQETYNALEGVTMNYIYKVRSASRKGTPELFKTTKQKEIIRLNNLRVSPADISKQIGCSRQYVYKVLSGKSKKSILPFVRGYQVQDEYLTPLYAVIPIEKYLKPHSLIWCPFDKEQSLFVRYFRLQGHTVVATHIENGQDFFQTTPPKGCDYIISNPPYSLKTIVFEHLNELGLPYAMLVGSTGIFSSKSRFDLFKDGIEQMIFQTRVAYMKDYESGEIAANPPFDSCYICKGVLPQQLVFEEIDKKLLTL